MGRSDDEVDQDKDEDEDEGEHSFPYTEGWLDAAAHGVEAGGAVSVTVPPSSKLPKAVRVE